LKECALKTTYYTLTEIKKTKGDYIFFGVPSRITLKILNT
jgi:hypothetical protein